MSSVMAPACKAPSMNVPGKSVSLPEYRRPPLSARSASSSSVPQLTDLDTSPYKFVANPSGPIDIPSPPLTPLMGLGLKFDGDEICDDFEGILSSRFQWQHQHQQQTHTQTQQQQTRQQQQLQQLPSPPDELSLSLSRYSSSAPSVVSPIEMMRTLNDPPKTGFTFSSNITQDEGKAKEDSESYDFFVNTMEEDYWKSVSTIRTTYFFDGIGRGGGFLAIPHLASHGNAKTNVICRLLEAWLTKKLVEPTISDSIPVLEDNIQSSVQSIEQHLRQESKVWAGISRSFIRIRCGHVFVLDTCCDDDTIVHLGADEFYQDYPLFVDVEIKMHCDATQQSKESSTEVLIAFENVMNRNKKMNGTDKPYVHRAIFNCEPKRRQSHDEAC
ncbi:hypothetical protein BGX28_002903 [Mortierella sp. GBA30]|nr:hypothetical protein BGX28_002903 [Mortierella sp. GBA30]